MPHLLTIDTRLTIIDKRSSNFSTAQDEQEVPILDLPDLTNEPVMTLLKAIPPRRKAQIESRLPIIRSPQPQQHSIIQSEPSNSPIHAIEEAIEVHYQVVDSLPNASQLSDAIYEVYQFRRIRIEGSRPHPTTLCESIALASVSPPIPQYQPQPQRRGELAL